MLLTGLDASILATSLPTIVSDLHGGALYIWTMNGYFLTTAVVQPLMGQAGDIFGRRIPMLVTLSFTLGSFLGPIIGGAIVDNTTWRWVFYINLPICAAALPLVFLFLRVNHKREGTIAQRLGRVDYSGNFILGKLAREPTMPLRVYSNMSCALGYGITSLHGIVLSWLSFFLPVYFQILLESTPLQSGVKLLAVVIPLAPAGMAGGIAIAITGHYKMVIVAGFVLLSIAVGCMTTLDANSSTAVWIVFQVLAGLGGGLSLTATLPAVQAPVPESDVAIATAAWAFARSFGAIWGAAIPSAVFNSRFDELLHLIPEPSVRELLAHGGAYEHAIRLFIKQFDAQPVLKEQIIHVYTEALKRVWIVLIPFAVVPIVLALCIKEVELRQELKTDFGLKEASQTRG
ncbi:Efflux pump FUS6 [Colletotrichum sp. SAR 10_77]|nr:Efflux pump FUS6 [Colletotrichum sp. SAR 10_77]